MGGFEEKKKEEEKELPTGDVAKDALLEYMPKYVDASAPAQELLGMSHPGAETLDPWSIDADAPFPAMDGAQMAEDIEAKALFKETFEFGSGIAGALGIASGVDDFTNSKLGAEKRAKGAISAAGGLASLIPGAAEVGPATAAGVAAYDMTKAGSQDLQHDGFFGKRDGENRDAAQWSSDVGSEVGASLAFENGHMVKRDGGTLGKIVGGAGVLAASAVSGMASFGVGAYDTAKDFAKPILPDDMAKAAEEVKRREREDDEKEKVYEEKMKHASPDEAKVLLAQHLFGTGD